MRRRVFIFEVGKGWRCKGERVYMFKVREVDDGGRGKRVLCYDIGFYLV